MLVPMTMRVWVMLASLSLVCLTMAESNTNIVSEDRAGTPSLWIDEIRKVSCETENAYRDHDVKIVLREHIHIVGVSTWTLTFLRNGFQSISSLDAATETDGNQRVFVFKTELVTDANAVLVTAKGKSGNVLAAGTLYVRIPDLDSTVARVGAAHHPSSPSSLRVDPGTMPEIQIGSRVCRRDEAPCYILEEEDLPEVVPRCLSLPDELTSAYVAVCDETVVPFHDLSQTPSLSITDDFLLEVSMALPQDVSVGGIEVVAYDPRDPSVVYSPDGFRCNPSPGVGDQGESTCTQRLQMTEAKDVVSVLLVHPNGVHTASKLLTLGGQTPRAQTGVIVGSVVGGLVGLALIAVVVIFVLRRRKNKAKKQSLRGSSSHYTPTPTSDPVVA